MSSGRSRTTTTTVDPYASMPDWLASATREDLERRGPIMDEAARLAELYADPDASVAGMSRNEQQAMQAMLGANQRAQRDLAQATQRTRRMTDDARDMVGDAGFDPSGAAGRIDRLGQDVGRMDDGMDPAMAMTGDAGFDASGVSGELQRLAQQAGARDMDMGQAQDLLQSAGFDPSQYQDLISNLASRADGQQADFGQAFDTQAQREAMMGDMDRFADVQGR